MAELLETIVDGVAVLTLNRPERLNALTPGMMDGLRAALVRLADDGEVGAVILTGAGRGFCAGGDVRAVAEGDRPQASSSASREARLRERMESSRLLHEMPKPTIAALPGAAAGAGLSLALACDIRIAARGAKLTTAFARVGLSGDFGGSYFLTRLVGSARARELYYFPRVIDADEAEQLGIVNRVVEPSELQRTALEMARQLASGPRVALRFMKANFNRAETASLSECLDLEAHHHTRSTDTSDHLEGARAFAERRDPVFRGH